MSLISVLHEGNGKRKKGRRRKERREKGRKERIQNISPKKKGSGKGLFLYLFEDENPHTSNSIIAIVTSQTGIV